MMMKVTALTLGAACLAATAGAQELRPDGARPVLANPYDDVAMIQEKKAVVDDNEMRIRELYQQTMARSSDAETGIREHLAGLRSREISAGDREQLMAMGAPVFMTDRLEGGTDAQPRNLFLESWELLRSPDGTPVAGRVGDPMSRISIRPGMILGEFGRVQAVRGTRDAFYIVLESGDRIRGVPKDDAG